MSDRAVTYFKFDNMLVKYQKKVIPLYKAGFSNLTPDQQNAVSELGNFFWGLCLIVVMADTVCCIKT